MIENKITSAAEAIALMKENGIKFEIVSEAEAKQILTERNYYHKLTAYCENYAIGQRGANRGKYLNLDFAYLKELAVIDMYLRYLLIHMCLDIEHHVRLMLIQNIEQNPKENGYRIVELFDPPPHNARQRVFAHLSGNYTRNRARAYQEDFHIPVWALCEFITFGELCRLYRLYVAQYPNCGLPKYSMLNAIRNMRNNCAHNTCLIANLYKPERVKKVSDISNEISRIGTITTSARNKYLSFPPIHDFAIVLYWYGKYVQSAGLKRKRKIELRNLFFHRIRQNQNFFKSNDSLKGAYLFCIKLLSYFLKNY